jgi:hypothetical protein
MDPQNAPDRESIFVNITAVGGSAIAMFLIVLSDYLSDASSKLVGKLGVALMIEVVLAIVAYNWIKRSRLP